MEIANKKHNSSRISVIDLCPYWTWPTTGGGPERVYHLNKVAAQSVDIIQASIRPTIGHQKGGIKNWVGNRSYQHAPGYQENQYFNALILATCYLLYKGGRHSDLYLSNLLETFGTKAIKQIIEKSDVIQVEHPWLFEYAARNSKGRPIVFVAHNVEANLWEAPVNNKKQRRSTKDLEQFAAKSANAVVCMSDQDAGVFTSCYGIDPQKITVIPNGADFRFSKNITQERKLEAKRKLQLEGKFVILFAGSDHFPNKEALNFIQEWQTLLRGEPNIQFVVIGTVGRGVQSTANLRIEGFVEDASTYFLAADIALNPLVSGSGTSLKIVDYLSYQLPTITTETGIRGLSLKPDYDVLLSEIPNFPHHILDLYKNHTQKSYLGKNGSETVRKLYSWEDLGRRMVSVYERVKP